ncbi:hypothetical protein [Salipaludibacillus aurantiacus]|uniref:Uncharacterized protein n=1 Tax=Salipaludibacillus aurantiacus TaxID=1601833 RepID=A0A1H9VXK4_9BACI|nr:hypothetical protein [Salipaludibacillus aurantiacus]SES26259.1 hypothetical protein SAMN05518684_11332 [Salipaludibacillus aurantiacus]
MSPKLIKRYGIIGALIIFTIFLAASIYTNMTDDEADEGQSNQEIGQVVGFAAGSMTRMNEGGSLNSLRAHVRLIDELKLMEVLENRAGRENQNQFRKLDIFFSNLRNRLDEKDAGDLTAKEAAHLNQTGRLLNLIADKIYADHYDIEAEVEQMNLDF